MTPAPPLPGRAFTAAEPCLLQSECHRVRRGPELLLLAEGTRSPRGGLEILVREKEARACCLHCFKTDTVLFSWGIRIFPRIFTRASGVITTIWELNWEKKGQQRKNA